MLGPERDEDGEFYEDESPINEMGIGQNRQFPILNSIELDDKIISSHANKMKRFYQKPIFDEMEVAIPVLDEMREIVYVEQDINGEKKRFPLLKKIVKVKYISGWEKKDFEFPIANYFTDSTTSSTLSNDEARVIRLIDINALKLGSKIMKNPDKFDCYNALYYLADLKISIAETAKGIGGSAVEKAKTTITKSEAQSRLYRLDKEELDEMRERKEQGSRGLLGMNLGFGPFKI